MRTITTLPCLAAILCFQPRVIYGYPTALALLAQHAARRCDPRWFSWLRMIVLTGEEVAANQVAQVREVFGCTVVSEYGSRETGLIAHECPHGALHVVNSHVHVEIVQNGSPAPLGRSRP